MDLLFKKADLCLKGSPFTVKRWTFHCKIVDLLRGWFVQILSMYSNVLLTLDDVKSLALKLILL